MRLIKIHYPHIKWVVSFSDASQCGDGTIYRASGFNLIGIKENNQIIEFPDGHMSHIENKDAFLLQLMYFIDFI